MTDRLRIVVAGTLAGAGDQAGASWAALQYVLGFRELGHDVWFLEPDIDTDGRLARRLDRIAWEFGLGGRAFLGDGAEHPELDGADVLINLSGVLTGGPLLEAIDRRAYLDLDPAFNQFWHESGIDRGFDGHTHHFSYGTALGTDACPVPTCGIDWTPTLPPVVLRYWPVRPPPEWGPLTTIANWRSYGSIHHATGFHGQKAHSFRTLAELPQVLVEPFELALAIDPRETADLDRLAGNGWRLTDPDRVAGTPDAYQRFIGDSWAEIGVAKHGYVASRCGWFSDRSACYLASGRPVIAQDTGFGRMLPTGEGVLTFTDVASAAAAVRTLRIDYARHATAARALAETYLDSRRILTRLLDEIGATR